MRRRALPAMPGEVLLCVRHEVALRDMPSHRDVRSRQRAPALHVDHGPADRALACHSRACLVSRIHHAARAQRLPGQGDEGWDPLERQLGLPRLLRVRVHPQVSLPHLVEDLRACETVAWAVPNRLCRTPFALGARHQPSDPFTRIGHSEALAMEPGDSALIVGVVDSGIDSALADFSGRLRPGIDTVDIGSGPGDGVEMLGDYDVRDRDPMDENGHGTACAGIIGAQGLHVPPGLAGAARLLPARVLANAREAGETSAIGTIADIDAGVKAAIDLGARVLNLSFGTPEDAIPAGDPVPHVEIVRYALERDCLLIAAAGNSGDRTRYYPACLPGVIAVGAVDAHDRPASFTTRGEYVALCAPGCGIPALALGQQDPTAVTGTSFAAPFVTAACALLHARALRQARSLSSAAARAALVAGASAFAADHDHTGCGAGILDVPAALRAVDDYAEDPLAESVAAPPALSNA